MKPTEHLTITERPGTYITVMSDSRGPIIVVSDGPGARASRYTPEEAAKLGLAILEAAGYKEHSKANLGSSELLASYGMTKLRQAVQAQEREESEARELAELEAEALELVNAWRAEGGEKLLERWDAEEGDMIQSKPFWLAVARRAREIAKEATK